MAVIEAVSLTDGMMTNVASLNTEMASKTELTASEINTNTALKSALLGKIKFNGATISNDDASKFAITVTKSSSNYSITYTYNGTGETYTRTFKMALS